jgi:hypothetical protein
MGRHKNGDCLLKETKIAIVDNFNNNHSGVFNYEKKQSLKDLELKRTKMLRDHEVD